MCACVRQLLWTWKVICHLLAGKEHNFNKYSHGQIDHLTRNYDFDSLMHYGEKAFSKNGKPTIQALGDPSKQFGQRSGFSANDIIELNALYDCSSKQLLFPSIVNNRMTLTITTASSVTLSWLPHRHVMRTWETFSGFHSKVNLRISVNILLIYFETYQVYADN